MKSLRTTINKLATNKWNQIDKLYEFKLLVLLLSYI
jgi:hypothetical protein